MNRVILIASCTTTALLTLVIVQAGYFFLMPHDKSFAPEVGLAGSFLLFTMIYVISFFIAIVIFEGSMLRKAINTLRWAQVVSYSGILTIISSGLLMLAVHDFSIKSILLVTIVHAIPSFLYVALRTRLLLSS